MDGEYKIIKSKTWYLKYYIYNVVYFIYNINNYVMSNIKVTFCNILERKKYFYFKYKTISNVLVILLIIIL